MFLWVENGGKLHVESKLHLKSQEQTSQAVNSKKTCEHYLLHQTGMKFILGNKASATLI